MCPCNNPWIGIPLILTIVINLFVLLVGLEHGPMWKQINDQGYRQLTLGGWLAMFFFTPASLIYLFFKYFFKVIGYVLSWRPIKDEVIR